MSTTEQSKIEWCHWTFNPWRGCTKVSPGCANCYADKLSLRNPKTLGVWGPRGTRVVAAESYWRQPIAWDREAAEAGERRRVFCASLADVLEGRDTMPADALSGVRAARVRLFDLIRMTPNLDWLLLTKRPGNWRNIIEETIILAEGGDPDDKNYFADRDGSFPANELSDWLNEWTGGNPPANVWLGTSVENQAAADERIPHLLRCPAAVRFLSCEPLLGAVDIGPFLSDLEGGLGVQMFNGISWVIVGGESGSGARPCNVEHVRSLIAHCRTASVPVFVKQLGRLPYVDKGGRSFCEEVGPLKDPKGGDWSEWPQDIRVREFPEVARA